MIIRNDSDRALHIVYQGEDITIPPDGEVSCEEQHRDEDGSDLGAELACATDLRSAIEALDWRRSKK